MSGIATILSIVTLSIPDWLLVKTTSGTAKYGLFRACSSTVVCSSYSLSKSKLSSLFYIFNFETCLLFPEVMCIIFLTSHKTQRYSLSIEIYHETVAYIVAFKSKLRDPKVQDCVLIYLLNC